MQNFKRRLGKLAPPDRPEMRVLRAMPNPEEIAALRQQARDLEAQGYEVLLIERVLVDPPLRPAAALS